MIMKKLLLPAFLLFQLHTIGQTILYVDDAGGNDGNTGLSWPNAYKTIGKALQEAHTTIAGAVNIRVAGGTYYTTGAPNPALPGAAFAITRGAVKIYGAYNPANGERDFQFSPTILNGALDWTTKSRNLLFISGIAGADSVVVDGFSFTMADPAGNSEQGALVIKNNTANTIAIRQCVFDENTGYTAAAVSLSYTRALIDRCLFRRAMALGGYSITATNAVFTLANSAYTESYGAPLNINSNSQATIINSLFGGNNDAGAHIDASSSASYTNCTITEHAGYGIANEGTLDLRNCIVMQNSNGLNSTGTANITYSLVQGRSGGTGNLDGNATGMALFGSGATPYGLSGCSPAVNAGNNAYVTAPYDILADGTPRIKMGTVDLGAYELNSLAGYNTGLTNSPAATATGWQLDNWYTYYGTDCNNLLATVSGVGSANTIGGNTTVKSWVEATNPGNYVRRHIEVMPDNNSANAEGIVILYFTQADFDVFNAVNAVKLPTGPGDYAGMSNLQVERRAGASDDGTGWPVSYTGDIQTITNGELSVGWESSTNRWEVFFPIKVSGGFFVKTQSAVLPLKLISFTATQHNHANQLQWKTTGETDTKQFVIERNSDHSEFTQLGIIEAVGAGDNHYTFEDRHAPTGTVRYRLRMIDHDGTVTLSSVVTVKSQTDRVAVRVFPSIVHDHITIQTDNHAYLGAAIQLTDMNGKVIWRHRLTSSSYTIHTAGLPRGMYILKLDNQVLQKVIKQ